MLTVTEYILISERFQTFSVFITKWYHIYNLFWHIISCWKIISKQSVINWLHQNDNRLLFFNVLSMALAYICGWCLSGGLCPTAVHCEHGSQHMTDGFIDTYGQTNMSTYHWSQFITVSLTLSWLKGDK